jgi:hypothetical protein
LNLTNKSVAEDAISSTFQLKSSLHVPTNNVKIITEASDMDGLKHTQCASAYFGGPGDEKS